MRKLILLAATAIFTAALTAGAHRLTVVDDNDMQPVIGASIITRTGLIAGITDINGVADNINEHDYPLTVHSIGYKDARLDSTTDTLRMTTDTYSLPEVTVTPGKRPIMRVVAYATEHTTGVYNGDTLQFFSEYMVENYNKTVKKVKGYSDFDKLKKIKGVNQVFRHVKSDGTDTVARPRNGENAVSLFTLLGEIPATPLTLSDSLKHGLVDADTIMGKYSPYTITRKTPNSYIVTYDDLADSKNRKWSPTIFKLVGITMDFHEFSSTRIYAPSDNGVLGVHDLVSYTSSARVTARGKWVKWALHSKTPIELNSYVQVFPVSITYLTVEEYKEQRKDRLPVPIKPSPLAPPLHPSVKSMLERVMAIEHAGESAATAEKQ